MKIRAKKIITCSFITVIVVLGSVCAIYKWGIPALVNNSCIINFAEKQLQKTLNADIKIQNPKLKTGKIIAFSIDNFSINKQGKNYLTLSNLDTVFSFEEIFKKRIIIEKIFADNIYVDVYNLMQILPKSDKPKKEQEELPVELDFYNALLGIKNVDIDYHSPDIIADFKAKNTVFDRTKSRKFIHFNFDLNMSKDGHNISISADDKNRIYTENCVAYIKDFPIEIEKSNIVVNASMSKKGKYELNVSAHKFNVKDITDIISSNLIIANGSRMLEQLTDISGTVNFDIKLTNNNLGGNIQAENVQFKVIPLLNLPVQITKGSVNIGNNDIELKDFEGFYNNNKQNKLTMKGYTKDYHKTCDTMIDSDIYVSNDFFKNYLSKMLGAPVQLVGHSTSKLILKSVNGSLDIVWYFLLKENNGFMFGEESMVLKDYKTLFTVDLSLVKNILKINKIDYHITKELKRGMSPVVQIKGNLDLADNMKLLDLSLNMPRPLPSEFLNFIACQKIFKKGTVSGNMAIDNHGNIPKMYGEFSLNKVVIPAQRLFIKSAKLIAKDNKISVVSKGRFKKAQYTFDGYILNELKLPIIVKDVNLTVDNIDVEKILQNGKAVEGNAQNALVSSGEVGEENSDAVQPFQKGLIEVEKCSLNLLKGVYKEMTFANLHADMILDKDGVLKLQSNKFDIADGISTLKINADLVKRNYYMRLGINDGNSDIMATAILGLPRQISGKAKGLIELNTDETLKLNGDIKFRIENGTIEQVGYVEYILKVASLFRNPLAMISPVTVVDLVNIPDGRFDDIYGELKLENNIIRHMKIQTSAPELATFITGRYDLTTNDAMLRIYTKISSKTKGFAGALRKLSLNSLASKLSISARNDSNYYAAELSQIPKLKHGEENAQVFLTKVDGDVLNFNFLSSLKRIK